MKMTFRWYGKSDPVTLEKISQIPQMSGIVSAIYDVPPGTVWPNERVEEIRNDAKAAGLRFDVVESVPVHEDIKIGAPTRDDLIGVYCENIRRLAKYGVKVVCYNFMPVFDWLRTDLAMRLPDNSTTLAYDNASMLAMDPKTAEMSLPGWDESYTKEGLRALIESYSQIDKEKLWKNYAYFISRVIPVCEEYDVKMAIHPDDPPWDIFGLPRIITGANSYARMKEICPSKYNGITLCTGSLGADKANNIVSMISKYGDRVYFVHARNVEWTSEHSFYESAHPSACGSLNMHAILKALYNAGFDGYIRPDHGRMIWGETGKPGYGLYDRALGATYLVGLWEAIAAAGRRSKSNSGRFNMAANA